jgi:hypothetical protein
MNLLNSSSLLILFLTCLFAFASCDDEKKTSRNETDMDRIKVEKNVASSIPEPGTEDGDTIFLAGQYVLFYLPSGSEVQDLKSGAAFNDLDQMLTDFEKTSGIISDSLNKAGDLKFGFTSKRFFKIYTRGGASMIMNKMYLKQPVGMVMSDGLQPPVTRYGVLTESEYHRALKEFFFR